VTLMVLWWPQWFSGGLIDSLINSVTPWWPQGHTGDLYVVSWWLLWYPLGNSKTSSLRYMAPNWSLWRPGDLSDALVISLAPWWHLKLTGDLYGSLVTSPAPWLERADTHIYVTGQRTLLPNTIWYNQRSLENSTWIFQGIGASLQYVHMYSKHRCTYCKMINSNMYICLKVSLVRLLNSLLLRRWKDVPILSLIKLYILRCLDVTSTHVSTTYNYDPNGSTSVGYEP
jgi:hypothetical protein